LLERKNTPCEFLDHLEHLKPVFLLPWEKLVFIYFYFPPAI
jgi:hypothetical protein